MPNTLCKSLSTCDSAEFIAPVSLGDCDFGSCDVLGVGVVSSVALISGLPSLSLPRSILNVPWRTIGFGGVCSNEEDDFSDVTCFFSPSSFRIVHKLSSKVFACNCFCLSSH